MLCVVTAKDEIIVGDLRDDSLIIFGPDRKYIKTLGGDNDIGRFIKNPYSFATYDDQIYILDTVLQRIGVFNFEGIMSHSFAISRINANKIGILKDGEIVIGNSTGNFIIYHKYGKVIRNFYIEGTRVLFCIDNKTNGIWIVYMNNGGTYDGLTEKNGEKCPGPFGCDVSWTQILLKNDRRYWIRKSSFGTCGGGIPHSLDIGDDKKSGIVFHNITSVGIMNTDEIVVCDEDSVKLYKVNEKEKKAELTGVLKWPTNTKIPILLQCNDIFDQSPIKIIQTNASPTQSQLIIHFKIGTNVSINGNQVQCSKIECTNGNYLVYNEFNTVISNTKLTNSIEINTGFISDDVAVKSMIATGIDIEFISQVKYVNLKGQCSAIVCGNVTNSIHTIDGLISCDTVDTVITENGNVTDVKSTSKNNLSHIDLNDTRYRYNYPFRIIGPVDRATLHDCTAMFHESVGVLNGENTILTLDAVPIVKSVNAHICVNKVISAKSIHGNVILKSQTNSNSIHDLFYFFVFFFGNLYSFSIDTISISCNSLLTVKFIQ